MTSLDLYSVGVFCAVQSPLNVRNYVGVDCLNYPED